MRHYLSLGLLHLLFEASSARVVAPTSAHDDGNGKGNGNGNDGDADADATKRDLAG